MDVVLGLIVLGIGVILGGTGLRVHEITLPVGAFIAGVTGGAAAISTAFGDGFLTSALGLGVGLLIGSIAAATAHFFWYAGAVLTAGLAGGFLGATIVATFGVENRWLLLLAGFACAAGCIAGALAFNFPVYIVVVETALIGAILALAGVMLILDEIDRQDVGTGGLRSYLADHTWSWIVLAIALVAGIAIQLPAARHEALPGEHQARLNASRPFH